MMTVFLEMGMYGKVSLSPFSATVVFSRKMGRHKRGIEGDALAQYPT
jgi:hypothetical protein